MTTGNPAHVTTRDRDLFHAAAIAFGRALDSGERSPRRFGPHTDTRWASFKGALSDSDRIDCFLRDNEPSDAFGGMMLGDSVAIEGHGLQVAIDFTKATDDLRSWTPPAAPKKKTVDPDEDHTTFLRWPLEADIESDVHTAFFEGPTLEDLASKVGATKGLVNRAMRAEGRVEKLDGRPARFVAVGGEA